MTSFWIILAGSLLVQAPVRAQSAGSPEPVLDQSIGGLTDSSTPRLGIGEAPSSVHFDRITMSDGLSQSTVLSLLQDPEGFIWLGTQSGLNRYDGRDFTIYRHDVFDSLSVVFRTVSSLISQRDGTLWVGTLGGLSRRDPGTDRFHSYKHVPEDSLSLSSNRIYALELEPDGRLWIGTRNGLNLFDPDTGTATVSRNPGGPEANQIFALHRDKNGLLWAGTGSGLATVNVDSQELALVHLRDDKGSSLQTGKVTSILEAANGVWIGTEYGVFLVDSASLKAKKYHTVNQSAREPRHIVQDPRDDAILWIGATGGGIERLDTRSGTGKWYSFEKGDETNRASDRVKSMVVDHAGLIWIGMENSGARKFDPHSGSMEHLLPGGNRFPDNRFVASIYEDRSGALWTGTMSPGLLTRIDRTTKKYQFFRNEPRRQTSLSPGRINAILEDTSGNLWVGTDVGGLNRMGPSGNGEFKHYRHDPSDSRSLISDSVTVLHQDRRGRIWVAYYFLGVLDRYNPETDDFTHFQLGKTPGTGSVYGFFEDDDGTFWVSSGDLFRFDPDTGEVMDRYTRDPHNPESNRGESSGIFRDGDGFVWVTSLQGGLSRLDPTTRVFKHYGPDNSNLPDDELYHVLEDDEGFLWTSSNRGLSRMNKGTESFLNISQGIQSLEFSTFAAYKSPRTGEMFFGGPNGLNAFYPSDFGSNKIPPRVVLTRLSISGKEVKPGPNSVLSRPLNDTRTIRLGPENRDFSFDFIALHFSHPEGNTYAYQLEPYDSDWMTTDVPVGSYTNIDSGTYTFRVRAANSDGIWNTDPVEIRIVRVPYWWAKMWVRITAVLALLAALAASIQWRIRSIQSRSIQLERDVSERTREVRRQHDQLEAQASKLRELAEVKSHFFANISHEFRTPLTLIFGPLDDAIAGRFKSLSEARIHFERARRNGSRLLRLINQLLDLSKADSGMQVLQPVRGPIDRKIREIASLFDSIAQAGNVRFTRHFPDDDVICVFDADKIEKIVANLLSNAFKFTPSGGKVGLSLHATQDSVVLSISDTGQGISPEDLSHVFDRFFQAETDSTRSFEGSGIGLSLVKEFVELHEGTVDVESSPGIGTRFVVTIPFLSMPAVSESESPSESALTLTVEPSFEETLFPPIEREPHQANEAKGAVTDSDDGQDELLILVVEDNADMRAYLASHLASKFSIVEAQNGKIGVSLARELVPDLILSDVMMPVMDGIELCREVKTDERTSHIPVLLLTARADVADRMAGFESGADAYMPKPFNADELNVRINALIEERRRLQRLFGRLEQDSPELKVRGHISEREFAFLDKVQGTIQDRISDAGLNVEILAAQIKMSRRQLLRKLQALTSKSATELIRTIRMDRAAALLSENDLSVKEVCFAVGFQSASSFTKAFKSRFGTTPSEYADNPGFYKSES